MKYVFRSDMLTRLSGKSPGDFRRLASWLLLPICYFGALIAPSVLLAVPFQLLHKHKFPPAVFWGSLGIFGALVLCLLTLAVISWLRFFRQRIIHIEPAILFVGLILAVAAMLWIYPPK
ncbi:MAG TPA: hypothetical protein VIV82_11525 [Verrucomicrobiae bacterium]|jgi:hypothetical protein